MSYKVNIYIRCVLIINCVLVTFFLSAQNIYVELKDTTVTAYEIKKGEWLQDGFYYHQSEVWDSVGVDTIK